MNLRIRGRSRTWVLVMLGSSSLACSEDAEDGALGARTGHAGASQFSLRTPAQSEAMDDGNPLEESGELPSGDDPDSQYDVTSSSSSSSSSTTVGEAGETPECGNAVIEDGEVCDDGIDNGTLDQCDGECAFVCQGACPVRVDPQLDTPGDGRSWRSAFTSVQAAIDQQGDLGGGEVWVIGPGPFPTLAGDRVLTLMTLRENVRVIGGFAGTERQLEERDPEMRTAIVGAEPNDDNDPVVPVVIGASNSTLESFDIADHWGTVLHYETAENFRVSNVAIADSTIVSGSEVMVTDSSGSFENFLSRNAYGADDGVAGFEATRSRVRLATSEFTSLSAEYGAVGFRATDSTLVLDNVWFVDTNLGLGSSIGWNNSDVLAIDSVWLGFFGDVPVVTVWDSRFVAVNTHWEDLGSGSSLVSIHGSEATFLNSSFVHNNILFGSVVHVNEGDLEMVNTTFFDNETDYPEDSGVTGPGENATITLHNSFSDNEDVLFEPNPASGNCILDADAIPNERTEHGYSEIFLLPEFGCTDGGNDEAVRAATERVQAFATSLGETVPLEGDWWPPLTSVSGLCGDTGQIDPGRHYESEVCE